LEQETGLNPTEIMTDTAGASELVFGLFWLQMKWGETHQQSCEITLPELRQEPQQATGR
ncbi:Tn3 family transposase, partial [Klebsiella pneumoniae]|nr:Tn3 family transposase [Klebsiella pneumoniae]